MTAAIALLAMLPAGASAIKLTYTMAPYGTWLYAYDDAGEENEVGVTTVALDPAHPDIVIGDLKAGIPDPIPPDCARVDPTIVRCPASGKFGLNIRFGAGNDSLSVAREFTYMAAPLNAARASAGYAGAAVPNVQVQFGPGADVGSDLSVAKDIWNGGPGKDRFNSGPGNDKVNGGAQNDVIDCGAGKHDVGIGGPGKRDLGIHCETVKH